MFAPMKLGHLAFEVSNLARWRGFCDTVLGLGAGNAGPDGRVDYATGRAGQTLSLTQGPRDDLAGIGLELPDIAALSRFSARLIDAGIVAEGPDLVFRDPEGLAIHAYVGQKEAAASAELPTLGHAALVVSDLPRMECFYVDVLGFRVTERLSTRVGPIDVRGIFLHCDEVHHTLALFALPLRRRLHHFMLEVPRLDMVGHAFERAKAAKVPLSLGLGQHPAPDGTFSFYGCSPSGFDFEIGTGSGRIDPAEWSEMITSTTSTWGHKPTMGLQLRTLREMLSVKLRGHARAA
jgi:catechol 2,3-dioxygenase-like lactoylglutathione lyase family enzyme